VVAKLYKLASVPRRDLLSIELVVIGVDGNTGPKTSPVMEEKNDLTSFNIWRPDEFLPHKVMEALGLPKTYRRNLE
jgi:hypothetical protein